MANLLGKILGLGDDDGDESRPRGDRGDARRHRDRSRDADDRRPASRLADQKRNVRTGAESVAPVRRRAVDEKDEERDLRRERIEEADDLQDVEDDEQEDLPRRPGAPTRGAAADLDDEDEDEDEDGVADDAEDEPAPPIRRAPRAQQPADADRPQRRPSSRPKGHDDVARTPRADSSSSRSAPPDAPAPRRPRLSGRKAVRAACEQLLELSGLQVESASGLSRTAEGWRVILEVVELERIPRSTDILASYEVEVDDEGELTSYERIGRYYRNQPGGEAM